MFPNIDYVQMYIIFFLKNLKIYVIHNYMNIMFIVVFSHVSVASCIEKQLEEF